MSQATQHGLGAGRGVAVGEPRVAVARRASSYALFVLVTATLFVRPGEIVPAIESWPLYQILIAICLVTSLPAVLSQITNRSLLERPITTCVVGLLFAIVLSHLTKMFLWGARTSGIEFSKVLAYYLLLVGLVHSEARLRNFLGWMLVFVTLLTSVAVLQRAGLIELPGLEALRVTQYDAEADALVTITRLRSTGIFHDPNDLAMILVLGAMLALYFLFDRRWGFYRLAIVGPIVLFGAALAMTYSRGGFLSLVVALGTLFYFRFGGMKSLAVAAVSLPVVFVLFGGRMTEFYAISRGTGQTRIQLWSEGFTLLREQPFFGIGAGEYSERLGQVAHNSFVHCYVELGLLGGTLFLGAYFAAFVVLLRIRRRQIAEHTAGEPLGRLLPYLAAVVAGYVGGMLALSRAYIVPSYAVLGLVSSYAEIAARGGHGPWLRFDRRFVQRLLLVSAAFVVVTYLFIRVMVRWS